MRRILFGGTFDPIHEGHLSMAEHARRLLGAERVVLIPNARSPHKPDGAHAAAAHRLAMVRLAAAEREGLEVVDDEIVRGGASYTIDTVERLQAGRFAGDALVLLLGQDSLPELPRWHRAAELVRLLPIAVVPRPGAAEPPWDELTEAFGASFVEGLRRRRLPVPTLDVSSTDIRRRVREGASIRCRCPDPVVDYIEAHGLYREPDDKSACELGENR